jgi:hypothetical protein
MPFHRLARSIRCLLTPSPHPESRDAVPPLRKAYLDAPFELKLTLIRNPLEALAAKAPRKRFQGPNY